MRLATRVTIVVVHINIAVIEICQVVKNSTELFACCSWLQVVVGLLFFYSDLMSEKWLYFFGEVFQANDQDLCFVS